MDAGRLMAPLEHFFADRAAASQAAADMLAGALRRALGDSDETTVVVSGGSTPLDCFDMLSKQPLDWSKVNVLLSDERLVADDHPDSNSAMVTRTLIQNEAAEAQLVPMVQVDQTPQAQSDALAVQLSQLPLPMATALLGMGSDGHFASLFPDFDRLEEGLDINGETACLPVSTVASPHPRLSLTLATLVNSREVILLFFGADKRAVYEQARAGVGGFPVQALLMQDHTPVHIVWAP